MSRATGCTIGIGVVLGWVHRAKGDTHRCRTVSIRVLAGVIIRWSLRTTSARSRASWQLGVWVSTFYIFFINWKINYCLLIHYYLSFFIVQSDLITIFLINLSTLSILFHPSIYLLLNIHFLHTSIALNLILALISYQLHHLKNISKLLCLLYLFTFTCYSSNSSSINKAENNSLHITTL